MSRSVSAPASAVFLFGELQGVEPRVVAAARQQLGVAALLDDAPVVHHVDDVGRDHGGEAVGDDEGGAPSDQLSQRLLNIALRLAFLGGGPLVHQPVWGVFLPCPRPCLRISSCLYILCSY